MRRITDRLSPLGDQELKWNNFLYSVFLKKDKWEEIVNNYYQGNKHLNVRIDRICIVIELNGKKETKPLNQLKFYDNYYKENSENLSQLLENIFDINELHLTEFEEREVSWYREAYIENTTIAREYYTLTIENSIRACIKIFRESIPYIKEENLIKLAQEDFDTRAAFLKKKKQKFIEIKASCEETLKKYNDKDYAYGKYESFNHYRLEARIIIAESYINEITDRLSCHKHPW
jgi:hypothetical protein